MSIFERIKKFLVQDVPAELEICEGACREVNCTREKFENCERRIVAKRETKHDDEANQEETMLIRFTHSTDSIEEGNYEIF